MKRLYVLVLLVLSTFTWAGDDFLPQNKPHKPEITVSKETTYLTEPLASDGAIDYVAALNQIESKGVTRENNAFIPMLDIFGPELINEEHRQAVLKALGIKLPKTQRNYFVPHWEYIDSFEDFEQMESIEEEFDIGLGRGGRYPIAAKDFPNVVKWTERNHNSLDTLSIATHKSQLYVPYVSNMNPPQLYDGLLVINLHVVRSAGKGLCARAMLRIEQGNMDGACEDLMTLHRLARLLGQRGFLIQRLVGASLDRMANEAEFYLAANHKLTIPQIKSLTTAIDKLPPLNNDLPKLYERSERYFGLDYITLLARYGLNDGVFSFEKTDTIPNVPIEWNQILKDYLLRNQQVVEACNRKTYSEKSKALEQIEKQDRDALKAVGIEHKENNIFGILDTRKQLITALNRLKDTNRKSSTSVVSTILLRNSPGSEKHYVSLATRNPAQSALVKTAFGLSAYHQNHDTYPKTLAELSPKYLKTIPLDPFSDKPLIYRREGKGYILYSVGANQKDDGGEGEDEKDAGLVVRAAS